MNKREINFIVSIIALGILFILIVAVMSYFFFSKTEKGVIYGKNIQEIDIEENIDIYLDDFSLEKIN